MKAFARGFYIGSKTSQYPNPMSMRVLLANLVATYAFLAAGWGTLHVLKLQNSDLTLLIGFTICAATFSAIAAVWFPSQREEK